MPIFDLRDRTIHVGRTEIAIDRVVKLGDVHRNTTGWHLHVYYGKSMTGGSWFPMHFDTELEACAIRAIFQEYINARAV